LFRVTNFYSDVFRATANFRDSAENFSTTTHA